MPPPNKRSMITSVKYHVQQWINLVLYNSIYQNLILLYLYRTFKFIFGYLDQSTELSRICGATHYPTPLDSLWDELGNPTSSLLNDKQGGTIAYTNALTPVTLAGNGNALGGGARRGTIHVGTNSNRNSTESVHSSLSQESGQCSNDSILSTGTTISSSATVVEKGELNEALSEIHTGSGNTHQLKHRKKRRESSGSLTSSISSRSSHSSSTATAPIMDLRQSKAAAEMVYRIDRCILFSKQLTAERRELEGAECDPVQITQQILRKKKFPDSGSPNTPAAKRLQYALDRVASTHQLAREINQRVHTKYDSTNPTHERKLMLLWDLLRPQEKRSGRYTKQWTEIGFQGKDPATDFRGMGMLGLDDLVYYAKYYPVSSKHALECSHREPAWYSFAIVGINITAFAVQTLRTRQLQYYLFLNGTDISVYHELYCYLFHRFNGYWTTLEPKPSIMDFERVFADFKVMMERQLARRKLMMLRFDTNEILGSGGYPIAHQHQRHSLAQEEKSEGEAIELEAKKVL